MTTQKLADNYFRITEQHSPAEGVTADLLIDKIDGEYLDTQVTLSGGFCIAGSQRQEFLDMLGHLIEAYRI